MFKKLNLFVLIGVLAAAFVFAAPASASTGDTDISCRNWRYCALDDPGLQDSPVVNLDENGDEVNCRHWRICALTTPDMEDVQVCGFHRLYCIGNVPIGPTLDYLDTVPTPRLTTVYIN